MNKKSMNIFPAMGENNAEEEIPLQTENVSLSGALVRRTWLHYYNDYLREQNVITDEEWRKMCRLIDKNQRKDA